MKISELKPNPKNPRKITDAKLVMLRNALVEFGDISGVVFNRKSKQLVGGHQRTKVFDDAVVNIEKKYKKPTRSGTVAEGFIVLKGGERFNYREVSWDPQKEKAANLAANKGAGEWDYGLLGEWMQELIDDKYFDLGLTMFDENERKGFFTDLWEHDDTESVEKENAHVEGFRDTIKVRCPKSSVVEVRALLRKTIEASKYRDAVEVED